MSEAKAQLRAAIAPFETPSTWHGVLQLATSIGLYIATLALMYWSLGISYWLTLALSLPAGVLLVRVFIVQHDCGHGAFFASRRANDLLGRLCGVLTLVPYQNWRRQHAGHHANWNNLDRRESGADIYSTCLTIAEYRALSPWRRFFYRLPRHPLLANLVFPPLVFLLLYRTPFDTPKTWKRERRSVWLTNLSIAAAVLVLGCLLGFRAVLLVHLPVVTITAIIGVWLFSVQHRFEGAQWLRRNEWNFADASLNGTSYLVLPRILHWMTGNIGFHHLHHLSQRIPNYRLMACDRQNAQLRPQRPLTLWRALAAGGLTLWDEEAGRLVRFRDVRSAPKLFET
jgi:omega-6 fatty acid desaturase (delta-12 desaturase)